MRPTMHKLSEKYSNKLTFISVTYQSLTEAKPFINKVQLKNPMPEVVADELLQQWFPHKVLPHYVWIDPNGVVKAITGSDEINEEQVVKTIYQQGGELKMKREFDREFDMTKEFQYYTAQDTSIKVMMSSSLTRHMLGVSSESASNVKNNKFSITCTNLSLWFLYRIAYSYPRFISSKMIEYEVADKSRLISSLKGSALSDWRMKNAYCYQVSVPDNNKAIAFSRMQYDLAQFFPMYKSSLVKKQRPCFVLEVVGDTSLLKTKGGKPFIEFNDQLMVLKNAKLEAMIDRLTKYVYWDLPPVFLQEGLDVRVDLDINANLKDIDAFNKELQKYGLALVTRNRIQDVLIISDNRPIPIK
jgi:hypothetical protein